MPRRNLAAFALLSCAVASIAATDDKAISELASDISKITQKATKTKQNIDYMPYIMSVWEGEKLEKLGALTLKDALMLFAGVDISTDNIGGSSLIFRGSNPFAYGQSRLLIDGVVVNDRTMDAYSAYLSMPIELVKRIEVVRGPGSFVEGASGYAGTINVVTYAEEGSKEGGKACMGVGSQKANFAGAVYNGKLSKWHFHIDAYYYKDAATIDTNGKDALSYSPINAAFSRSGAAQIWQDNKAVALSLSNEDFSISSRITSHKTGSAFGNLNVLPNDDGRQEMPSWYVEAKYKKEILEDVFAEAKIGYMEDGWKSYSQSYPAGVTMITVPPGGGAPVSVLYPDGYWADLALRNSITYGGLSFKYLGFDGHTPKIGAYQSDEKNLEVRSVTTNRTTGTGWFDYSSSAPFFDGPSAKRKTTKLYLSDTWDISDDVALSAELNSDKGGDFDRQNDYRLAAVWQVSDVDIVKLMTSTAYRAPAWQELYGMNNPARVGNKNLKPERVKAYEAQYIKKLRHEDSIGANIFYLENKNQINKINSANQFRNSSDSRITGAEIEYKNKFDFGGFLYLGYSYITGTTTSEDSLPAAASNMLKGAFTSKIGNGFSIGTTVIYVGEKKRVYTDTRENTPAYTTADLAVNYDTKIWGAQAGVKNIADATILYPSEQRTYSGDYPIGKRFFFVKLYGRF